MRLRRGFTLIELLLVMLVLAILAGIAYGRYQATKRRGYIATMTADLAELRIAEEGYWAENQLYSTDTTQLDWRSTSQVTVVITSSNLQAGFDAEARHVAVPGLVCTMYVGRATGGRPSGEVACQ
jgi:type IV pilus assembly protein PilE